MTDTPAFSVSLVVSTLGRTEEVARLLESIDRQTLGRVELILVDQNDDERLTTLLANHRYGFDLRHLRCPGERGLSHGRNVGWRLARADKVIFPDDDCWYPADFLERIVTVMDETGSDIVSGRAADDTGRSINGKYSDRRQVIDRSNVWATQIEWMVLFRKRVLEAVGGYDERIGVGASTPWQSSEGQDIVLRAMKKGFRALYDPTLTGRHHELNVTSPDRAMQRKGRIYGRGMGRVLQIHRFGMFEKLWWIARPLGGALLNLPRSSARARYLLSVFVGRCEGLLGQTWERNSSG